MPEDKLLHNVTDRELLAATFDLIASLAEKITGQRVVVPMETEAGIVLITRGQEIKFEEKLPQPR